MGCCRGPRSRRPRLPPSIRRHAARRRRRPSRPRRAAPPRCAGSRAGPPGPPRRQMSSPYSPTRTCFIPLSLPGMCTRCDRGQAAAGSPPRRTRPRPRSSRRSRRPCSRSVRLPPSPHRPRHMRSRAAVAAAARPQSQHATLRALPSPPSPAPAMQHAARPMSTTRATPPPRPPRPAAAAPPPRRRRQPSPPRARLASRFRRSSCGSSTAPSRPPAPSLRPSTGWRLGSTRRAPGSTRMAAALPSGRAAATGCARSCTRMWRGSPASPRNSSRSATWPRCSRRTARASSPSGCRPRASACGRVATGSQARRGCCARDSRAPSASRPSRRPPRREG